MTLTSELLLTAGGLISGILAGFLGAGGGFLCVPLLLALNYTPVQSLGTSCLAVSIIAISGSIQNSRMGYFDLKRVLYIGIPALITTQISVSAVSLVKPYLLLLSSGILMLLLIYLVELRKRLVARAKKAAAIEETAYSPSAAYGNSSVAYAIEPPPTQIRRSALTLRSLTSKQLFTGSLAGLFAGALGGGSGSLLVPLQILILGESIKIAIQTSVGVNIITSTSAWLGHAMRGNVLFLEGFLLAIGGFIGAQMGTRFLPKLPDKTITLAFNTLIVLLSLFIFWKAWQSYSSI
jgi:uncharacterized protein